MNRLKVSASIISLFVSVSLYSQILNGSFEDWGVNSNNMELPLHWDALPPNSDSSVIKSTNATDGNFSLQMSSLNFLEGSFSPSYIGTKFIPSGMHSVFKFYYLIDSISGASNAVINFYQRDTNGDYQLILSKKYNQISEDFIGEEINIEFQSLDTVLVVLVAQNHQIIFGFDGFIRVLFDDVKIDISSSQVNLENTACNVQNIYHLYDAIYLNTSCLNDKYFKIYSLSGELIDFGSIGNRVKYILPGLYVLVITDFQDNNRILKLIIL